MRLAALSSVLGCVQNKLSAADRINFEFDCDVLSAYDICTESVILLDDLPLVGRIDDQLLGSVVEADCALGSNRFSRNFRRVFEL